MGTLSRIFSNIVNPMENRNLHIPMLNSITAAYSNYLTSYGQIQKKKALMAWYKKTPELCALANKVAKDVVSNFYFEPVNPNDNGRNKILRANKFAQQVQLRKQMLSQQIDKLITGEAFGWIGKISEKELAKEIDFAVSHTKYSTEQKEILKQYMFQELKRAEGFADVSGVDEDLLRPRKYRVLPSSTMKIIYDQYDIKEYVQWVGVNKEVFSTKETIHFPYMTVDGKPEGFTPIESILVQLELLRLMWQNMAAIHKNGGTPDVILALKNVSPNSPAYDRVREQIEKYKLVENKHGAMLFTGDLSVNEINSIEKMQFMDSGLYITGVIAMHWQIPRSSIPFIIGSANTKDDTGGNSERSYWSNIEFEQEEYADIINSQLFIPYFGVKIKFKRQYDNKDIQEEQAKQLKVNNVIAIENSLMKNRKQLTFDAKARLFDLTYEDVEDADMEAAFPEMTLNNQMGDQKNESDAKKNVKAKKKEEQEATMSSDGKYTGYGKEDWDDKTFREYKELDSFDTNEVSIDDFLKIYRDEGLNNEIPKRIFVKIKDDILSLKFKGSDFTYKTNINKSDISKLLVSGIKVENLYRL